MTADVVSKVHGALYVPPAEAEHLLPVVFSLDRAAVPLIVGGPNVAALKPFAEAGCTCLVAADPADLVNKVWAMKRTAILAISDCVSLPEQFLWRALQIAADDLRVATVSFWSNDAALLSLPHRNRPVPTLIEGHDAASLTRILRSRGPHLTPTPIPTPKGAAVLVTESGLGAVGDLLVGPRPVLDTSLAEFSARAHTRGFVHVLDDETFYARHRHPASVPVAPETTDDLDLGDRHWVHVRHPTEVGYVDREATSTASPLALAFGVACAKVRGLRVAVDGSYLGPHEMGTQVATLAAIESLSRRSDVREVVVALATEIPEYAKDVLTGPKVRAMAVPFDQLELLGHCDVAHRMLQADATFSVDAWRRVADRVILTVLDLIAFRTGAYHRSMEEWLDYRDGFRRGIESADGVTTISVDVRVQLESERLPIESRRLVAIPLGTGHVSENEPAEIPDELLAQGFAEAPYLLCLGTDYTHKNRDLAMATTAELRRRGRDLRLVMGGPSVPYGSSRIAEAAVGLANRPALDDAAIFLPTLPTAQRNWLLRHASLVLYPTSAEGFGLVPFEAARLGTASLFVGFGPLIEMVPDLPVVAQGWSPIDLANAAERLLGDAKLTDRQIASCLAAGSAYTWDIMAERLTEMYRDILALPSC